MAAQRPHWGIGAAEAEAEVTERWERKQGVRREGEKIMRKSERTRQGRASVGKGHSRKKQQRDHQDGLHTRTWVVARMSTAPMRVPTGDTG